MHQILYHRIKELIKTPQTSTVFSRVQLLKFKGRVARQPISWAAMTMVPHRKIRRIWDEKTWWLGRISNTNQTWRMERVVLTILVGALAWGMNLTSFTTRESIQIVKLCSTKVTLSIIMHQIRNLQRCNLAHYTSRRWLKEGRHLWISGWPINTVTPLRRQYPNLPSTLQILVMDSKLHRKWTQVEACLT